ncbi:MAG: hypothetical protein WA843_02070 [Candidatus Saccharimonadales bacterium]
MKKPLHLIYIPGLGDHRNKGQRWAVSTWCWWGVEAEFFLMNWADKETWELKFERLLARIDELAKNGESVALVGASAGASAAINAFAARKDVVAGVVCVAGKINRPKAIREHYKQTDPAFVTSVVACQQALASLTAKDRARILSRFAVFDGVVTTSDSRIPGARNRFTPMIGHPTTIAFQLIFGAPGFIRFLKQTTLGIK